MEKIRKGDNVVVLTGKDKGKRGVVSQRVDADYVKVDGINVVKKHQRPNPMLQREGGIVEKVMPIHVSNVALFNTKTQKADRVAIKEVDGKKVRVFKSNGEVVA
jgi:large subunit ribosomal protein L24